MKQPITLLAILILIILDGLFSCKQQQGNREADKALSADITIKKPAAVDTTFVNGNVTTIISTNIDKLGKFLDFTTYKPTKVKFKYTYIDNSGQNQRLTIPGPSDYSLQALLYFDSLTFMKLYNFDGQVKDSFSNYNKEAFRFDWLEKHILNELESSNAGSHEHADLFFGTTNGRLWYLDEKVLIQKWTN